MNSDNFINSTNPFINAKSIFSAGLPGIGTQYIDFADSFTLVSSVDTVLYLYVSGAFCLWINDKIVDFSKTADTKNSCTVEKIDVSSYVKTGHNRLFITSVIPQAADTASSVTRVIFEIIQSGNSILASSKNTLSGISRTYKSGTNDVIFTNFNEGDDSYLKASEELGFEPDNFSVFAGPRRKLNAPRIGTLISCGLFDFGRNYRTTYDHPQSFYAENASLVPKKENEITDGKAFSSDTLGDISPLRSGRGLFAKYDFDAEIYGFPMLEIDLPHSAVVTISCGKVITMLLKEGKNRIIIPITRVSARFLTVFTEAASFRLNLAALIPIEFPLDESRFAHFSSNNFIDEVIFKSQVEDIRRRLSHYDNDAPCAPTELRLLNLCSYYALGEYDVPRLKIEQLLTNPPGDITNHDLTSIVISICEYALFSGDVAFLDQNAKFIQKAMDYKDSPLYETAVALVKTMAKFSENLSPVPETDVVSDCPHIDFGDPDYVLYDNSVKFLASGGDISQIMCALESYCAKKLLNGEKSVGSLVPMLIYCKFVLGITPTAPGFASFDTCPRYYKNRNLTGSIFTPAGTIGVEIKYRSYSVF